MRSHLPTGAQYPGRVSTEKDRPEQDRHEIDVDPSVTPTQIKVAGAVKSHKNLRCLVPLILRKGRFYLV